MKTKTDRPEIKIDLEINRIGSSFNRVGDNVDLYEKVFRYRSNGAIIEESKDTWALIILTGEWIIPFNLGKEEDL
jgi:hypothetical protein